VDVDDDLVQEAFLRFLRSTSAASLGEPQMRGYLYRTLETLIVDRWRRLHREKELALDTTSEPAAPGTTETDPDVTLAFSQLDHKQRALLWLAYVEGFNHKEIAATAGVKEKSVKVLLFRARQKLAAILKRASPRLEVL